MRELRNLALVGLLLFLPQLAEAQRNAWIATWATSPEWADPNPKNPLLNVDDQTVRERVRVSVGGAQICLRFSNEYGSAPLIIGSATVGVPNDPASVRTGSASNSHFRRPQFGDYRRQSTRIGMRA